MILIVFLLPFIIYVSSLNQTISLGDSGEMVTAATTLGILHPPGYPLYPLLAHIFTFIPFNSPAWRVNLFSAFAGALTVLFLYLLIYRVTSSRLAALGASWLLAFTPTFWSYANYAKGYVPFAFLLSILFYLKVVSTNKAISALALVAGLATCIYMQFMLLLIPVLIIFVFTRINYLKLLPLFLIGLTPYLYLPLRALHDPYLNWCNPCTWGGFCEMILKKGYTWELGQAGLIQSLNQVKLFFALMIKDFTVIGVALGSLGIGIGLTRKRKGSWFWLISWIVLWGGVCFLSHFPIGEYTEKIMKGFFIPSYLLFTYWIGVGISFFKKIGQESFKLFLIVTLIFLLIIVRYPQCNRRGEEFASEYGRNVLVSLPFNSIIITHTDDCSFPLYYLQSAEKLRPDVKIVVYDLIMVPWYRDQLKRRYSFDIDPYSGSGTKEGDILALVKQVKQPVFCDRRAYLSLKKLPLNFSQWGIIYKIGKDPQWLKISENLWNSHYRYLSVFRQGIYRDIAVRDLLEIYSNCLNDLAVAENNEGKTLKAISNLRLAIQFNPDNETSKANLKILTK